MKWISPPALILAFTLLAVHSLRADAPTTAPATLFDPAKHMRVSEVREGMKGYGLSVFQGTRIDRFDVEVLSILHNFNPKYDVVLIRCHGANLEHTASIAGMSGSPIYLKDDQGRERMIGAFAYGWSLMKDPIAGVQPIEYMLALPANAGVPTTQPGGVSRTVQASLDSRREEQAVGRAVWTLDDVVALPGSRGAPKTYPLASWNSFAPNPKLLAAGDDVRLTPLATPLMTAGLSPKLVEQFEPIFKSLGLIPLQSGGIAGSGAPQEIAAELEPGSVLAVPLLSGDADMSAVGTCTEVVGDRIFGFGHAFNNEGPVHLPMGSGRVNGVIANYMTSFKLGSLTKLRGTLTTDQTVGISGTLGDVPTMVPIDLRTTYADGSEDQQFHFNAALHPRFTPLLSAAALGAAVSGIKELPQYHTLDYDLTLDFNNGSTIRVENTTVNTTVADLFFEIGTPIIAAAENPFERVQLKKISGTMRVTSEVCEGKILYVNVPRLKYQPGETVKAFVTFRPFRAAEMMLPVELELPRDLPDGTYRLTVSDWEQYLTEERLAEPFRFTAQTSGEVFDVLKYVAGVRRNALYIRLLRQPDGVAVGRTAMPKLPSSRREILVGSGRSDTTQFVSSATKVIPTQRVMSGSAEFQITIDKNINTESPLQKARHEAKPPAIKPAAKPDAPTKTDTVPGEPAK